MTPEIEKVFDLIAEDKLSAAFELLDDATKGSWFFKSRIANIKASHKKIEDDYVKGILNNEDYYAEKAEIRDRLLKLVQQINKKDTVRAKTGIPSWVLGGALVILMGALVWIYSGENTPPKTKLDFSGDWEIAYTDYHNCNHEPYNDNLELVYKFQIDHQKGNITGKGSKYAETFNGEEKIYTEGRIPATLNGKISNQKLMLNLNYLNSKDQDIIERIVVNLDKESTLSFRGTFESEASNCKGKVKLKKGR